MTIDSTKSAIGSSEGGHFLCDDWFDPLETGVRTRIRGFIEELLEAELDAVLGRDRYERPRMGGGNSPIGAVGSRHGHRERGLMGTFGATRPPKKFEGHASGLSISFLDNHVKNGDQHDWVRDSCHSL